MPRVVVHLSLYLPNFKIYQEPNDCFSMTVSLNLGEE